MNRFHFVLTLVITQLLFINCDAAAVSATEKEPGKEVPSVPDSGFETAHPRILLFEDEEKAFKKFINSERCWINIHNTIIRGSERLLSEPPIERVLVGRRLLETSRKALRNIFFLSYSYRMTGDRVYASRCEKELLAVCGFEDWNPSHFLDVGEMCLGVAIGYDWIYDALSDESRATIARALLEKGIEPSYNSEYNFFIDSKNNWNHVCHAGMLYAAIAVYDVYRDTARQVIDRSISHLYTGAFAPDGTYAEGAGYWSYGTSYLALFISALTKLAGSDCGLMDSPGLRQTPVYAQQMIAPDGKIFNYSDSDALKKVGLNTTLFWFADQLDDPTLLWMQKPILDDESISHIGNRILPALLIWSKGMKVSDIRTPPGRMFVGHGVNPVALMRTSWNSTRSRYLGFKSGTGRCSHAHLDVGSFVFVSDEVRWAEDLGMQDYFSLEEAGLDIWDYSQGSDRWKVFRYTNVSHNTLTFDGKLQYSSGKSTIDRYGERDGLMFAVSDISASYSGQAEKVVRGAAIVDDEYAVIRDEINSGGMSESVTWNMATKAEIGEFSEREIILKKDGKKLMVRLDYPADAVFTTVLGTPPAGWDAANDDVTFIRVECAVPADRTQVIQISLVPDWKNSSDYKFDRELSGWE